MKLVDVKSAFVESASSSSPAVEGRCRIVGIGLIPKVAATDGYVVVYQGVISLIDKTTSEASGDTLFQIPVIASAGYPVSVFTGFADSDGYVGFDNGIWVSESTEGGKTAPLTGFNLIVNYG